MSASFSTAGSIAGNPTSGLSGNMSIYKPTQSGVLSSSSLPSSPYTPPTSAPKINSNPFGSPSQGIIGSINQATGLGSSIPSNYGKVTGVLAPASSNSSGLSNTPDYNASNGYGTSTVTAPQNTNPNNLTPDQLKQGYSTVAGAYDPVTGLLKGANSPQNTPQNTPVYLNGQLTDYGRSIGAQDLNAPANNNAPGTLGNNGSSFSQNLGNVQIASNQGNSAAENTAYNQALEKSILLNAGAGNVQNAGLAGSENTLNQSSTDALGTDYANLFRPQSTGNLQGEKGIINPELSQAINAEAGVMQGVLPEQQLATQGAENVAGLTAPQPYGQTTQPFNPATGTYGTLPSGGTAGTGSLAAIGSLLQTQELGGQVKNLQGAQSQAQALSSNLSTLINQAGINPANGTLFTGAINGINQWLNNQSGDPQYQNAANLINEIASKYATILTPSGGSTTDYTSKIAHGLINGLASGQSIQAVLGDLDKNATDSIDALQNSASNSKGGASGSSNGTVTAGGYNYKQVNGVWQPA